MSKWMFRTSSSMFLLVLSMIIGGSVFAQYAMSYWDQKVLDQVDQVVSEYIENENKEGLFRKLVLLKQKESQFEDDAQALFMIYEVKKIIQDAINTIGQIDASADVSVSNFVSGEEEIEIKEEVVEEESPVVEVDQVQETVLTNTPPTPFKQMSKQDFYDTYAPFLLDASPIPDRCYTYFDQIDAIAKEYNFPTSVIISTWKREHSCYFKNPDNGRGNFQITSNEYPPGEITWNAFRGQIIDFIKFSRGKRGWYDNIQVFGPESIELTYDALDLNSVRKQAITYNGVYPDVRLDNSRYANENFTQARGGRDGIVATVIKVIGRELERR